MYTDNNTLKRLVTVIATPDLQMWLAHFGLLAGVALGADNAASSSTSLCLCMNLFS